MNNITPDYVNFETAKLLKEKGFNEFCNASYTEYLQDTEDYKKGIFFEHNGILKGRNSFHKDSKYYNLYSSPEISLVVKWLYLKHNIWIVVNVNIVNSWYFELYNLKDKRNAEIDTRDYRETMYNIPEQAYLEAIKYTLTKLI